MIDTTTGLAATLLQLADTYEVTASLPPILERSSGTSGGKPGSRMPPGMTEVMDADEHDSAVRAVDEWAEFLVHVLLEVPDIGVLPDDTPPRIRLAAHWAWIFEHHDDEGLREAIPTEARAHLAAMRTLSKRGTRRVSTTSPCLDITCAGQYIATIAGPDVSDDLVCDGCGDRVPASSWTAWNSRTEWVTVEHAARMAGTTVAAIKMRASRGKWRRTGEGRDVRYHRDDVMAASAVA